MTCAHMGHMQEVFPVLSPVRNPWPEVEVPWLLLLLLFLGPDLKGSCPDICSVSTWDLACSWLWEASSDACQSI